MNEQQKPQYESGIYGKAEARFGGKIAIEAVSFMGADGKERHGLTLSEFYNGGTVGSAPADQRTHEPQIYLVFDNMKSVELMETALVNVREMMKRDAEREPAPAEQQTDPLLSTPLTSCDLSVRTLNICKSNGINTLGDLTKISKIDWLKFRNGGKKSLMELDDLLKDNGLDWKPFNRY